MYFYIEGRFNHLNVGLSETDVNTFKTVCIGGFGCDKAELIYSEDGSNVRIHLYSLMRWTEEGGDYDLNGSFDLSPSAVSVNLGRIDIRTEPDGMIVLTSKRIVMAPKRGGTDDNRIL